jgi:hypothetical protein
MSADVFINADYGHLTGAFLPQVRHLSHKAIQSLARVGPTTLSTPLPPVCRSRITMFNIGIGD